MECNVFACRSALARIWSAKWTPPVDFLEVAACVCQLFIASLLNAPNCTARDTWYLRRSKSAKKRHKAAARTRMTPPSNLPSPHPAPTCGPTRPPRPRCRLRGALRLRPSAEVSHGRQTTTLRRGFVPVGAIAVGGCGSCAEPSIRARAPGKAKSKIRSSRVSLKRGSRRVRLRRVFEGHTTSHWHSSEHPSLTALH